MMKGRIKRNVTVLLSVLIVLQCAGAALAVPAAADVYSGTVLAAVNTDWTKSYSAKTFVTDAAVEPQCAETQSNGGSPQTKPTAWELLWDLTVPMTYDEAVRAQAAEGGVVEAQLSRKPYKVGDTRRIPKYPELPDNYDTMTIKMLFQWLIDYMRSSKLQLTCVYTDDVCTVWIEDESAWSDESIREIGSFVGTAIPQMEELFGDARIDTDNDGKFAIFIHSMPQSEIIVDKQGGTAFGYFSRLDLVDSRGRIGNVRLKNQYASSVFGGACADCFHINMVCDNLDQAKDIFVHEYQHYIHECYNYAGKDNASYLTPDESYIDEGFSSAAEAIVYPTDWRQDELIYCFNELQDGFSLVTWEDHMANYGLVYPFFQYIRTRYASLTGDKSEKYPGKGIYKHVLESRDRSNQDNTFGIIADILYPSDRYPALRNTEARCRQLITDFWLAVFYKDPQGDHGFNGEEWAEALYLQFETLDQDAHSVRNGMARFYNLNYGERGEVEILDAENGIRFVAIDEPMRCVTLDLNDGTGSSRTISAFDTRFTLPSQVKEPLYHEGFVLAGWALTADAGNAAYAPGDTVVVHDSLTLYAVWTPAQQIDTGVSYYFDLPSDEEITVQFVPNEDGVYYLDCDEPFHAVVFNSSLPYEETLSSKNSGALLKSGCTYTLHISFDARKDNERVSGQYMLKQRSTYYTLTFYLSPNAEKDDWYEIHRYGTTYTAPDYYTDSFGKDFLGWSTDPYDTSPMYLPGESITVSQDTELYAVIAPWSALRSGETITVPEGTEHLRFVPEETAVYRFTFKTTDDTYMFNVVNQEQLIDDPYNMRNVTRTYTMYAGREYYFFTENIASVKTELISKELQHTLSFLAINVFDYSPVKSLCVEMKGKNEYVIPEYKPVSVGYIGFEYWIDMFSGEKYYPGDTIKLDRDTVLCAASSSTYFDDFGDSDLSKLTGTIVKMFVRYIPIWIRCFVQRLRYFGLSGFLTSKSLP